MKNVFVLNSAVVGMVSVHQNCIAESTIEGAVTLEVDDSVEVAVGYSVDTVDGVQRFIAPPPTPPKVTAPQFKMLFTSKERIKAKSLRATDPGVDDFWDLLDDPRTTQVDLALASVQEGIEYVLTAVNAAGESLDVQSRKTAIISGIPL